MEKLHEYREAEDLAQARQIAKTVSHLPEPQRSRTLHTLAMDYVFDTGGFSARRFSAMVASVRAALAGSLAPDLRPPAATTPSRSEISLPCHPRERVTVEPGAIEAACPDCGRGFALGQAKPMGLSA